MSQQQHIFVVDDEAAARDMIGDYLKMHGFDVTLCDGGPSLRAAAEKTKPDLVVLDLNMPEEDGLSLIRYLKQSGNVPVIMLTATASPIDRVVGLELGADDYLAKPAELRELLARVRSVLRRSAAAAAGAGRHAEPHRQAGHQVARPRRARAARRGRQRASADRFGVQPAQGLRREPEAGADARAAARPRAGARFGGLRPRHRRAHHPHPHARSSPTRRTRRSSRRCAARATCSRPSSGGERVPRWRRGSVTIVSTKAHEETMKHRETISPAAKTRRKGMPLDSHPGGAEIGSGGRQNDRSHANSFVCRDPAGPRAHRRRSSVAPFNASARAAGRMSRALRLTGSAAPSRRFPRSSRPGAHCRSRPFPRATWARRRFPDCSLAEYRCVPA